MRVSVAIVGSGFGGIGAAVRLRQSGIRDFVVLERAGGIGGVWRDNVYPGCACDVESHLYSFSFAPNPEWRRSYSTRAEIQAYLERTARDHGVLPHLRFGREVTAAAWDAGRCLWKLETSRGAVESSSLVVATGALSDPVIPDLRGLERFAGPAFHSSRWDRRFDPEGRRVAVVGTGASAVQIVPAIQPRVARLILFQRTAAWVLPHRGRAISRVERAIFRHVPAVQRLVRGAIYLRREGYVPGFRHAWIARWFERKSLRHLRRSVLDPALRAKLTPDFRIGCKRVLLSDDYLAALGRPNAEVVTHPIVEVRQHSVVARDGVERAVDAIVFATGFRPTDPPLARSLRGRGDRTLAGAWAGSPQAHLGTTVAGFPNLFLLLGPNTILGHTSVVLMMEAQIEHLLRALEHMRRHRLAAIEPRPEAQAAFVAHVERRSLGTAWTAGGCRSWYLDRTGRNATLWPDFTWRFQRRASRFRPEEYLVEPGPA